MLCLNCFFELLKKITAHICKAKIKNKQSLFPPYQLIPSTITESNPSYFLNIENLNGTSNQIAF